MIDLCTRRHGQSSRNGSVSSPRSESRSSQSSDKSVLEPWRALLLLIPVRLGGEVLNPVYIPAIQTILANDMCLGIIGGKPKHSVFFVGFQGKCTENNSRRMIQCSVLLFPLILETDGITRMHSTSGSGEFVPLVQECISPITPPAIPPLSYPSCHTHPAVMHTPSCQPHHDPPPITHSTHAPCSSACWDTHTPTQVHTDIHPPPPPLRCEQNDRQVSKHYPAPNFDCGQ